MRITSNTIRLLKRLHAGEAIGAGEFSTVQQKELVKFLVEHHGLNYRRITKNRGAYTATDHARFQEACIQFSPVLKDLDDALRLAEGEVHSRAEKTELFGNSKQDSEDRTMKGFTLLADRMMEVSYLGRHFPIGPLAGLHVVDKATFSIPIEATVLIVENAECFYDHRWIANVGLKESEGPFILLYRSLLSEDGKLWLESIANRILYFGDFDLGGIRIYESEFKKRLGDKVSFIVPDDIEERIRRHGNPGLYTKQINEGYTSLSSNSRELEMLLSLIHRLQSTYEQEGYCIGERESLD